MIQSGYKMDYQNNLMSSSSSEKPMFFTSLGSSKWSGKLTPSLRMTVDDDVEDDDWVDDDDDLLEDEDDWEDDFLDEEEDEDDFADEDDDDFVFGYGGGSLNSDSYDYDDDDDLTMLGSRYSGLRERPPASPRRFRDSDSGREPKRSKANRPARPRRQDRFDEED